LARSSGDRVHTSDLNRTNAVGAVVHTDRHRSVTRTVRVPQLPATRPRQTLDVATPDEFGALVVRVAEWMENVADQLERLMPPLRDARTTSLDAERDGFVRAENARLRVLAALHDPIDGARPDPSVP
jgi:hypothetical protein